MPNVNTYKTTVGASQLRVQTLKLERDSRNLQLKRLRKLCQDLSWKITSFTRNNALQNVPPPVPVNHFINHLETWQTYSSGATLTFPRNTLPRISPWVPSY